jgi:hypothetical protein
MNSKTGEVFCTIYNINGRKQYCTKPIQNANGTLIIPISGLVQGAYQIVINNNALKTVLPFMITH